jgi:hypothetical protein
MVRMATPFVYTEPEIAAVLRVLPVAVSTWVRRGYLRPIALTSDGRALFAERDVEAAGRRLAAMENVRVLWPRQQATPDASGISLTRLHPRDSPMT